MRHARPRRRISGATAAAAGAAAVVVALLPVAFVANASSDRTPDGVRLGAVAGPTPTLTVPAAPLGPAPAAPVVAAAGTRPVARERAGTGGRTAARVRPATVPASFAFTGAGWGHGVGMSQDGAFGMASEGASANAILTHFYTGVKVRAVTDDVQLPVNIAHTAHAVAFHTEALAPHGGAVRVTLVTAHRRVGLAGDAHDAWTAVAAGSGITLRRDGKQVATGVREVDVLWAGTTAPPRKVGRGLSRHAATAISVTSTGTTEVSPGHEFRYGHLSLYAHGRGAGNHIEAVNVLSLHNEYLRGLGEVPSSWPVAALEAQAVAARSYALVKYEHGVQSGCNCVLDSGHGPYQDQNFVGYGKETATDGNRWVAAVAATERGAREGTAVTYRGQVAETFYFDSSGGRTEDAGAVWGTPVPYLKSVDDHWSLDPRYDPTFAHWGPEVRSQAAVSAAFHLSHVTSVRFTRSARGTIVATATARGGATSSMTSAALAHDLQLTSIWIRDTA